jgi:hypothetical protein
MRASRSNPLRRALSRRLFLGTTAGGLDITLDVHGVLRTRNSRVPAWSEDAS